MRSVLYLLNEMYREMEFKFCNIRSTDPLYKKENNATLKGKRKIRIYSVDFFVLKIINYFITIYFGIPIFTNGITY